MSTINTSTTPDHQAGATEKQRKSRTHIRQWLFIICALIFAMVLVGGATRLTGSGLSITEWKPIMGAIPPLSAGDWQEAFEKYKQIPQYEKINAGMSMVQFKSIFWWEWAHRFLGRFIGIAFLLPFLFFLGTKRIEPSLKPKLWVLFALGGLQGFVGWYMVSSGLVERTDVSQYRLALHLGLAVLIYAAIFWVALTLGKTTTSQSRAVSNAVKAQGNIIIGGIFLQIIAGAFVAGLKAGKSHNTWPLMDGYWIPNDLFIMQPAWKNLFENALTVQFNHRLLAYVVALLILFHLAYLIIKAIKPHLKGGLCLAIIMIAQVFLGIMTLLQFVPLDLALAHQGGAMVLLSIALWHRHNMTKAQDEI